MISNKLSEFSVFFFDLDGTLVDTNYANWLAYREALATIMPNKQMPVYCEEQRFDRKQLRLAFPYLDARTYATLILAKEKSYARFLDCTNLNKELIAFLRQVAPQHQTYLLTNCHKERALMLLKFWNLSSEFDDIICNESGKDYSDFNKYRTALAQLDISQKQILAFEDDELEIVKASMCGIVVINPKICL